MTSGSKSSSRMTSPNVTLLDGAYLDTEEEWDALITEVRRAGRAGLDTEFYGVNPKEKSCYGRSRIHVFSVAVPAERLSPRGFHYCRGWCLPARALDYPPLRALLEGEGVQWELHNKSVDEHSFANHGIRLGRSRCTLDLIRWYFPGLINLPGRFKAKTLMVSLLGRQPIATFKQVVAYTRTVVVTKTKTEIVKVCSCGEDGCRKRKGHEKREEKREVTTSKEKTVKDVYPLESIVPGHERWPLLVKYAIDDAVAAFQFGELADEARDPAPFPFHAPGESCAPRPTYTSAGTDAAIKVEQVGIPIDVAWSTETADRAIADEERELAWLYRWYVANAPHEGPHSRIKGMASKQAKNRGVDSIWSSPAKLIRLFDWHGFPHSPVWQKGKVKRGEVKMDHKALTWVMNNCADAKQVCAHLLKLKRIRSGKKYLIKCRDSGGMIHPIFGSAGDDDERSGAVTGRRGIKGELEAAQLPTDEDKDLYLVRKAIVATPIRGANTISS